MRLVSVKEQVTDDTAVSPLCHCSGTAAVLLTAVLLTVALQTVSLLWQTS